MLTLPGKLPTFSEFRLMISAEGPLMAVVYGACCPGLPGPARSASDKSAVWLVAGEMIAVPSANDALGVPHK